MLHIAKRGPVEEKPRVRPPAHLWLLEAFVTYCTDTGAKYEAAVEHFARMYPNMDVKGRLDQVTKELLVIMGPHYEEKANRVGVR